MKSRLFRIILAVTALSAGTAAQDYGSRLGMVQGSDVSFEPRGAGVMFGALDPTVRRWYVPQEHVETVMLL